MPRRTIAIAAALSVLALGSQLITGCSNSAGDIHSRSADLKYKRGNYQGAIDDYTKAIELAYVFRGAAKVQSGDAQGGIADFDKAIEINPQNAVNYYNRGIAKQLVVDRKGACGDWEKSISFPGHEYISWAQIGMYQC